MIKGLIHQEDIGILNVHAPKNTALICEWKGIKLKGEIEKSIISIGKFSIHPSAFNRTLVQKLTSV